MCECNGMIACQATQLLQHPSILLLPASHHPTSNDHPTSNNSSGTTNHPIPYTLHFGKFVVFALNQPEPHSYWLPRSAFPRRGPFGGRSANSCVALASLARRRQISQSGACGGYFNTQSSLFQLDHNGNHSNHHAAHLLLRAPTREQRSCRQSCRHSPRQSRRRRFCRCRHQHFHQYQHHKKRPAQL
jgi:hypothetical protein